MIGGEYLVVHDARMRLGHDRYLADLERQFSLAQPDGVPRQLTAGIADALLVGAAVWVPEAVVAKYEKSESKRLTPERIAPRGIMLFERPIVGTDRNDRNMWSRGLVWQSASYEDEAVLLIANLGHGDDVGDDFDADLGKLKLLDRSLYGGLHWYSTSIWALPGHVPAVIVEAMEQALSETPRPTPRPLRRSLERLGYEDPGTVVVL